MKYYYETTFCTFFIIPDIDNGSSLWIKDIDEIEDKLGWYPNADMAADDVFMCSTGFDDWDLQFDVMEPCDLSEWTPFL